jgi:hypothetical protein
MFEKPKGWTALSEADKQWAGTLQEMNIGRNLKTYAADNDTGRVRFIVENARKYRLTEVEAREALACAIEAKAIDSLKIMLDNFYGLWLAGNHYNGATYLTPLFVAAAETGSSDALVALINWQSSQERMPGYNKCSTTNIVNYAAHYKLEEALEAALDYARREGEKAGALNGALDIAARQGNKEKLDLLLKKGADIHHDKGAALYAAAKEDQQDMVVYLLSKGSIEDLTAYGTEIIGRLRENGAPASAVLSLENAHEKTLVLKNNALQEAERFSLVGPDILAETLPLPSGGKLTLMFNFATRQQIITTQEQSGTALQVVPFAGVENPEAIERAAQKFIDLGGDAKKTAMPKMRNVGSL